MKLIAALVLALALSACVTGDPGPDPDPEPQNAVDAGPDQPDAGDLLPFMAECTADEQCETGLCFTYNMGPSLCSHSCTTDDDCEDPSPGCNGMGICKRPQ